MFSEKPFQIALAISLIAHATIFFKLPAINFFLTRRALKQTKVTYVEEKSTPLSLKPCSQKLPLKSSRQILSKRVAPAPYIKREQIFKKVKAAPTRKPESVKPEVIAVKKKITLPPLRNEKISNPAYLNYYQIIRERIKRAAYQNYTHLVNGDVWLSFIILTDGQLTEVRINERKSTTYAYLKETAKKSIDDAAPFPNFPKDLNYPELSFNVIISFEIE
jgi:TonB family protein